MALIALSAMVERPEGVLGFADGEDDALHATFRSSLPCV